MTRKERIVAKRLKEYTDKEHEMLANILLISVSVIYDECRRSCKTCNCKKLCDDWYSLNKMNSPEKEGDKG